MAGICVLCNNLEGKAIILNDEQIDCCRCKIGKYDKDGVEGFYSRMKVQKEVKSIKEIEESCDKWDDRLKAKSQEK